MESETSPQTDHRFIIEKKTTVSDDVVENIKFGLSKVWDTEIGRERERVQCGYS